MMNASFPRLPDVPVGLLLVEVRRPHAPEQLVRGPLDRGGHPPYASVPRMPVGRMRRTATSTTRRAMLLAPVTLVRSNWA